MDQFVQSLQDGSLSVKQMQDCSPAALGRRTGRHEEALLLYLPGTKVNSRAALLKRMNRLVEISKLPPEEQAEPMKELDRGSRRTHCWCAR